MALAYLELLDLDDAAFRFGVDTGTSRFYQLRAGTGVRRDLGIDLVEDVYYATPLAENPAGGDPLGSRTEVAVPAARLARPGTHVQLVSFKSAERTSPAVSRAVRLPVSFTSVPRGPSDHAASFSGATVMNATSYQPARTIPCRTADLAGQASMDALLGSVLKFAEPIVRDLLKGAAPAPPGGSRPADGTGGASGAHGAAELVAALLKTLLGSIPGLANPPLSETKSAVPDNRFARPFVFGIDDALIGAAIGQLVQVLPQLANAANQKRIELRKADNQLTAGVLADINKRLLLDKLADLQKPTQPTGGGAGDAPDPAALAQLQQLLALLQQQGAPGAPAPPLAQPKSLRAYGFSNRATLSFQLADPVEWNGTKQAVFARDRKVVLNVRLDVGDPVPRTPLPKAILMVVFKDAADPAVRFSKTFRHKDVSAGAVLPCAFEPGELAHLPTGTPLAVVAELRWLSAKSGREVRALGSADIVLAGPYYVKDRGAETAGDVELRDMRLYRPFWHKLWESPVLDAAAPSRGRRKHLWELDVNLRYAVLLSGASPANGLMEPRLLQAARDPESLSEKTEGRMKAGIELSLAEVNKLQKLWNLEPLDAARLEAFAAPGFAARHATEFVHRVRLKGKAGQRGLVWVVPVFRLFGFTLVGVARTDEGGQVVATREEATHFPLPVAARLIGLNATDY